MIIMYCFTNGPVPPLAISTAQFLKLLIHLVLRTYNPHQPFIGRSLLTQVQYIKVRFSLSLTLEKKGSRVSGTKMSIIVSFRRNYTAQNNYVVTFWMILKNELNLEDEKNSLTLKRDQIGNRRTFSASLPDHSEPRRSYIEYESISIRYRDKRCSMIYWCPVYFCVATTVGSNSISHSRPLPQSRIASISHFFTCLHD